MTQKIGRCRFQDLPEHYQQLLTGGVEASNEVTVVPQNRPFSDIACLPLWFFFGITLAVAPWGWGIGAWALLAAIPLVVLIGKLLRGLPGTLGIRRQRLQGGGFCGLVLDSDSIVMRLHDILRVDTCAYIPWSHLENFWEGREYNEGSGNNRSGTFMLGFRTEGENSTVIKLASSYTYELKPHQLHRLFLERRKDLLGTWTPHLKEATFTFEGEPEGGTGVLRRDYGSDVIQQLPFRWEKQGQRAIKLEPTEGTADCPKIMVIGHDDIEPGVYRFELSRDFRDGESVFVLEFEEHVAGMAFYDLRQPG